MYTVQTLMERHGEALCLELVSGKRGTRKRIKVPEAHRPGLSLAGYMKSPSDKRVLIFGKAEIQYLKDLDPETRASRLKDVLCKLETPTVIVTRRCRPPKELVNMCEEHGIPLFRTPLKTMSLLSRLTMLLYQDFAPVISLHATLVEVYGVGVLIQGDSSVGKSEAALGLIEKGHRLISDDVVKVRKREGNYLEGFGADLTKHHMEIRGIGIINVAHLYGPVCIRNNKSIDLVVKLENWDDKSYYDRVGIEQNYCEILGIDLPFHILPVKPGRDVVLLLETIALNHRLKDMGYNSAKEFKRKLLEMTAR